MVLSHNFADMLSLKGNAEDFWQAQMERNLTFNSEVDNTRGKNIPNPRGFKPLRAVCVDMETAPSPLHPCGCEDLCVPDRHWTAPLEAAGQPQVLKIKSMHIDV